MKQKRTSSGVGNWRGFGRMLRQIDLPWLVIAIAFLAEFAYEYILLFLPTTSAALMAGSLEGQALVDTIIYYIGYGVSVTITLSMSSIAANLAVRNARRKLWDGMTRIRADYYDQHTPSALTSAVTNDLESAVRLLVMLIIQVIPGCYYLVEAMRTIGKYDPLLVLSVFIPLPLQIIYTVVVGRWNYRTQSSIYQRIGDLTGYLAERVKNLPLIKYFGTEKEELKNGEDVAQDLLKANMAATKVECVASGAITVINIIAQMVVIVMGAILLQQGRITTTQWVAFFLFSGSILTQFTTMLGYWESLKSIQGQVVRVVEVLEAPKEQTEQESKAAAALLLQPGPAPAVEFKNVSLSYGEKQALKNVTFTVPAGTATAIVGLTGSGKTTALNLMERFYETNEGSITLDGEDVSKLSLAQLRGRYSYVQQGAGIFGGTVREALTYGINRPLSDDEIINAARNAGAWGFIQRMPGRLDAGIAADGGSLSGGQRQRLVLAREFLRNADVLLLDEPTSALDARTARAIGETIFHLFQGKTILMVTHDMSLISGMDQIVVLQDGEIMGQGAYEQLLTDCPLFRDMVSTQQKKEDLPA